MGCLGGAGGTASIPPPPAQTETPPAPQSISPPSPASDMAKAEAQNPESLQPNQSPAADGNSPANIPSTQGNPSTGANSGGTASIPPPPAQTETSPAPQSIAESPEKIVEPIQNLFRAWATLDHNLYMAQWAPGAIQYYGKGHRQRSLNEISRQRNEDFKKYRRVDGRYWVLETKVTGDTAIVRIEYYMNFTKQDGKEVTDGTNGNRNQEIYLLVYDANNQRWLIKENRDYLGR